MQYTFIYLSVCGWVVHHIEKQQNTRALREFLVCGSKSQKLNSTSSVDESEIDIETNVALLRFLIDKSARLAGGRTQFRAS